MPTDETGGEAPTAPNDVLEVTAAIVTAHLRATSTSAAHVPGLIRQVYDALTELVDQEGSGSEAAAAVASPGPDRPDKEAEQRGAALQDSVFPWPGPTSLRGPRAGTRIGEAPSERFRSRSR